MPLEVGTSPRRRPQPRTTTAPSGRRAWGVTQASSVAPRAGSRAWLGLHFWRARLVAVAAAPRAAPAEHHRGQLAGVVDGGQGREAAHPQRRSHGSGGVAARLDEVLALAVLGLLAGVPGGHRAVIAHDAERNEGQTLRDPLIFRGSVISA